jgi:hypothetical protein
MDLELVSAIQGKRMIEFDYGGHHRVAEPHVYGRIRGVDELLVYQVAGSSSSGGLPQWRRVVVDRMSGLTISADVFPGPRPNPSGEHSVWDEYYAVVS